MALATSAAIAVYALPEQVKPPCATDPIMFLLLAVDAGYGKPVISTLPDSPEVWVNVAVTMLHQ